MSADVRLTMDGAVFLEESSKMTAARFWSSAIPTGNQTQFWLGPILPLDTGLLISIKGEPESFL